MKVFVSWSGEQSRIVAESLRAWLVLFFPSVEFWVSSADLIPGDRWHQVLTSELSKTNLGIICIDQNNLTSSWLLFEAGALSKSLDQGRIIPFLTDVEFSAVPDPLRYFQAVKNDRGGLRSVVQAISVILQDNHRSDDALDLMFDALYAKLGKVSRSDADRDTASLPVVEFYKTNGLIVLVEGCKITLTEREYALYLFFCARSGEKLPSFPYYKAVLPDFSTWLSGVRDGLFERSWRSTIQFYGGYAEIQNTVSSLRKKILNLRLSGFESELIPQRGRIGVNVIIKQDVL